MASNGERGIRQRVLQLVTTTGAATALIVGGFSSPVVATGFASTTGEIPPGLEPFYTQQVRWESCDGYSTDGSDLVGAGFECARVTVPIDYESPEGDTAQVALSRSRATGEKIGSLLVNPGGPGASGLGTAVVADGTELAERFDVVGFDPRGIGASTPRIDCLTSEETDAWRQDPVVDMTAEGIARAEQKSREYAARCAERTGTDVLAHVGTRDVVRDMDVIRAALGDAGLNYLGYSYGTRLGSAYAEAFPGNVRAMVLDGALDPQQDPVEEAVRQAAGFQQAFDAFAANCATREDCPLGADPAAAVARFRSLVDPLIDRPAATDDPRGLSYPNAISGVVATLYSPQGWEYLRTGLTELEQGRGDTLLLLADMYEGRFADGSYSNSGEAMAAVRCVDDAAVTDPAVAGELDTRSRAAAPFLDDGRTGDRHAVEVDGLPPIVVVSTTEDPATPYQAGVDLAKQLDAVLVTYRGTQHGVVLSGQWCIDLPVARYLVDLAVPEGDTTC
ncbi:alpha/beta hydrolase [Rhodococcus ruber]|uniref:alpha/beta hydrolase n=1 Tax=Rhodococcus ruber TaxID=1830 RepID=UPI0037850A50